MHVGELPVALKVLLCGRWCIHAFCGVYGGKEQKFWELREDFVIDYVFIFLYSISLDSHFCYFGNDAGKNVGHICVITSKGLVNL